jgi:hypothetical protein
MKLNDLLLSLVYLFGILALAAAQEDESPRRRLRIGKKWSLRMRDPSAIKPKIDLSSWLSAQKEQYAIMMPAPSAQNEDPVLSTQSFDTEFKTENAGSDYAVLSTQSIENEVLQDEPTADEPIPCPNGPEVDYKGDSADICSRIRFFCDEGLDYFAAGDCGCGCKPAE